MGFRLSFIKQEDFEKHVTRTILEYNECLNSIDLNKFNRNLIDPIKLIFDKTVFNETAENIIKMEIQRQRDKSNTNVIGYFHQNMFKYIDKCVVPSNGWDVIYTSDDYIYYIEMKNKHNTMNSSSASKTYMRMQNHLLTSKDKDKSICALVEVIAKRSQNIPWVISLDGIRQNSNEQLRRISIERFYEIVTGDKYAFRDICFQLPETLEKVISNNRALKVQKDTVFEELENLGSDLLISLYKLAFKTYEGFNFD